MKIAIACENNMVTEHFGHCESFSIFEVENNQINKSIVIAIRDIDQGFYLSFLGTWA